MIDFFNPRSLICFIALLQGVVFIALLVRRGRRDGTRADYWLALLLFLLCSALVTPFIGFAGVYDANPWLTYFPFGVYYATGVAIWLYTRDLTDARREFSPKELLLFVPAVVYLGARLFLFAHGVEWKNDFEDRYGRLFESTVFLTEFLWNLVFLSLAIRHYRKYRRWLDDNFSDTERIKFDWLRNFLYVFTVVYVLGAVFDFTNNFVFHLSYVQYFYFEVVLALATYYLALAGYLRSRTIDVRFRPAPPETEDAARRAVLSDDELERLKRRLETLMRDEKIYREPQLTLGELAKKLGVNTSALSYAINRGFGRNFNDFVNEFRIREVCETLARERRRSLLDVAFACGFNSKATFNRAFRKFTGRAPKEFQETAAAGPE
ncbi:MAG: AraC family transcriptional regulator [Acidobacteria bacterium]|nr:AraC family transcriptional regulator [Acidobacteriota bacterium]